MTTPTSKRQFFEEHMRYVAAQDIDTMVNQTYTDDAILYHNFPYFDGPPPLVNGFNDHHTPLLVACRDGHAEIVVELLKAGADVNAVEPVFGAVPLHKSVYNGHVEITQMLVEQDRINLNYQGATNGYTAVHDSLWHGYDQCATILINSGARLDLRGHDGKTPLDIATEVFGSDHQIVKFIQSKLDNA